MSTDTAARDAARRAYKGDMMATVRALEAQSELLTCRIRELEEVLSGLVKQHDYSVLDQGFEPSPLGELWLRARALLQGDGK